MAGLGDNTVDKSGGLSMAQEREPPSDCR